jgi:hypothetical protein
MHKAFRTPNLIMDDKACKKVCILVVPMHFHTVGWNSTSQDIVHNFIYIAAETCQHHPCIFSIRTFFTNQYLYSTKLVSINEFFSRNKCITPTSALKQCTQPCFFIAKYQVYRILHLRDHIISTTKNSPYPADFFGRHKQNVPPKVLFIAKGFTRRLVKQAHI